jgi:protein-L-isoaspartate(D-aspartate) O-methyltransferase
MVVSRAGRPNDLVLLRAFATVERHRFLGSGPWIVSEDGTRTGSDDPALVYQDVGIGLAPGVPTGLPSLHASLLAAARIRPGALVMHVGAGTGYFTAILAELVGSAGRVYAYEIDESLAARARVNVEPWPWVTVETRSGVCSPRQPVDLVYVNAGVQQLPRAWIDALSPGGRALFPLVPGNSEGAVFAIQHESRGYSARLVSRARFVPCIGAQDETARGRLIEAFHGASCDAVRSLHFAPEQPDGTVWFAGNDWWLSAADPV